MLHKVATREVWRATCRLLAVLCWSRVLSFKLTIYPSGLLMSRCKDAFMLLFWRVHTVFSKHVKRFLCLLLVATESGGAGWRAGKYTESRRRPAEDGTAADGAGGRMFGVEAGVRAPAEPSLRGRHGRTAQVLPGNAASSRPPTA